jgi:metal-responsive CopG/Arc/MetJ family transcriptional regulator
MKRAEKFVRQSVSLPPNLAKQVGAMAKRKKLSKNRMLLELIEHGIDAEKRKQQDFFVLAERFRNESNPDAATRLSHELGRIVFGG